MNSRYLHSTHTWHDVDDVREFRRHKNQKQIQAVAGGLSAFALFARHIEEQKQILLTFAEQVRLSPSGAPSSQASATTTLIGRRPMPDDSVNDEEGANMLVKHFEKLRSQWAVCITFECCRRTSLMQMNVYRVVGRTTRSCL